MNNLKLNLLNCYGIKKLNKDLTFGNKTFTIYAPNGSMKTSFAKTFNDLAKGQDSVDLVFPSRKTTREIETDGKDLNPKSVFVVEPYDGNFESERISTLLVNKELKTKYDTVHKDIAKSKSDLIKKLKQLSGLTGRKDDVEKTIESVFAKNFYDLILEIEGFVFNKESLPFHNISYQMIFNDKVISFLNTKNFKESIKEYVEKYFELIEKSSYLRKEFNFYHAENIQKQLAANNFFKAGHSINLSDGKTKKEYASEEELSVLLDNEKKTVLNNDDLQKRFNDIDAKLSNTELRAFRDYLLENQEVLPELLDLDEFAKKIWLAYFVNQKDMFLDLRTRYKNGQKQIKELVEKAAKEKTEWEEVVRIFNIRFSHLPFYLKIQNKEDVILKDEVATIDFVFKDGDDEKIYSKQNQKELLEILSTGEKRALYILNIIFEVEARKKEGDETLFIIDDIADSFDYKNKYAIIEYLKYMSEIDKFFMIILTHNFDFFRTVQSRGITSYDQCVIVVKNDSEVRLEQAEYIKNPFIRNWKDNLAENKKLIASIPFIRNIVEYTQGTANDDYLLLTSLLHHKDATDNLTLNEIKTVFERSIQNLSFPSSSMDQKIIDLIFNTAEDCLTADEGINLENKIVLSIAIRLKAEKFMKSKIIDTQFLSDLNSSLNQTWTLLKKYEEEFNNESNNIEILKRVNLITPENIHINSFMYEPILDMGDGELRDLYKTVRDKLI